MGVDYFPCDECEEIICDAGDYYRCENCSNHLCVRCGDDASKIRICRRCKHCNCNCKPYEMDILVLCNTCTTFSSPKKSLLINFLIKQAGYSNLSEAETAYWKSIDQNPVRYCWKITKSSWEINELNYPDNSSDNELSDESSDETSNNSSDETLDDSSSGSKISDN